MIYRILVACPALSFRIPETNQVFAFDVRLRGAGSCLGFVMWVLNLPAPDITNPRARFYFTEEGWDRIGRVVTRVASKEGHDVKVIRRKNPRRSQIVYQDALQVAILPAKARNDAEIYAESG